MICISAALKAQSDTVNYKISKIPHIRVDVLAKFPGGDFSKYIAANIDYQKKVDKNIRGLVVVSMKVDSIGHVSDVNVLKSMSPDVDAEVVRVIKTSPKWKPAMLNGRPIAMYMVFDIDMGIRGTPPTSPPKAPVPVVVPLVSKPVTVPPVNVKTIPPVEKKPVPIAAKKTIPVEKKPEIKAVKKPVPPFDKKPVPPVIKKPVPQIAKKVAPPVVKKPAPPVAKKVVPPVVKKPVPQVAKKVTPPVERKPVPQVVKKPIPPVVKKPVPQIVKKPLPPVEKKPVPQVVKKTTPPIEKKPAPQIVPKPTPPIVKAVIPPPVIKKPVPKVVAAPVVKKTKPPVVKRLKKEAIEKQQLLGQSSEALFPHGGLDAFFKYLSANIHYPILSKINKIEGEVKLSFVVDKDGQITDIEVVSAPAEDLAQEARRVLTASPKWKPAMQNGLVIDERFTVPINFKLKDLQTPPPQQ